MIVKILGILDILVAMLFWLSTFFHIIPSSIIIFFAICLLAKGLFFVILEHIASAFDIIVAILMFVSLSHSIPSLIIFLITFLLLQKGVLSLV